VIDASDPSPGSPVRRPWLAGFAAFNAFAAWAGAFGLFTGGTDFGESIDDRLPFDSLVLAGLALVTIVGVPLTVLAWSAWTGGQKTDGLALLAGLMLIGWIVGQVIVIRAFSFFQPAYLAVGSAFVVASHRRRRSRGHRHPVRRRRTGDGVGGRRRRPHRRVRDATGRVAAASRRLPRREPGVTGGGRDSASGSHPYRVAGRRTTPRNAAGQSTIAL